jgi:ribonuclease HI
MAYHSDQKFIERVRLYVDGASLSNPGPSAVGMVLYDQDWEEIGRFSQIIGPATCNVAEYSAVIFGLDISAKHTRKIVEGQITGRYRLIDDYLRRLFHDVKDRERPFENVIYCKTRRNDQRLAIAHHVAHDALNGRAHAQA